MVYNNTPVTKNKCPKIKHVSLKKNYFFKEISFPLFLKTTFGNVLNLWYMHRFLLKTALSLCILTSCETTPPDIEGLDYEKWELDKFGCDGDRMKMVRLITVNKEDFFRYRQNEIIDILGKPDNLTLYERGQTIYFYYIKYHPNCPDIPYRAEEERVKLEIRFDALNRSKELYVYNY